MGAVLAAGCGSDGSPQVLGASTGISAGALDDADPATTVKPAADTTGTPAEVGDCYDRVLVTDDDINTYTTTCTPEQRAAVAYMIAKNRNLPTAIFDIGEKYDEPDGADWVFGQFHDFIQNGLMNVAVQPELRSDAAKLYFGVINLGDLDRPGEVFPMFARFMEDDNGTTHFYVPLADRYFAGGPQELSSREVWHGPEYNTITVEYPEENYRMIHEFRTVNYDAWGRTFTAAVRTDRDYIEGSVVPTTPAYSAPPLVTAGGTYNMPKVCDMPAATWVDGAHPDNDRNVGLGVVETAATGDLNGDGAPDTVIRTSCTYGGNGSETGLYAFDSTGEYLGQVPWYESVPADEFPGGVTLEGVDESGKILASISWFADGDPGCCPSNSDQVAFTWNGTGFDAGDPS